MIRASDVSLAAMRAELRDLDRRRAVPRIGVPVAFLLGRHDRHADARLAAAYLPTPGRILEAIAETRHSCVGGGRDRHADLRRRRGARNGGGG